MEKRKRTFSEMQDTDDQDSESFQEKPKRRRRVKIKLEDCPLVTNLNELIELGKTIKFYKNIDIVTLWRICPYLEELNSLIGMDNLKHTIFLQVIYYLQNMHIRNSNEEYLHTVIYGPPGCGKTTVAKIIGNIYKSLNILSPNGEFKTADRSELIAGYLGQTAIKTKKLLTSCIGGVLFIDEAYSLAPRNSDRDSFSKEAIDTLNAFLSEHKNDFCCIIAGYETEIKNCFFSMNKGLERRFPWVHRIQEYSEENMYSIFIKMVKRAGWNYSFEKEKFIEIYKQNKELFSFGGGSLETYFSKCKMYHAYRVFPLKKEYKFILTEKDLQGAILLLIENKNSDIDIPPPHMYM